MTDETLHRLLKLAEKGLYDRVIAEKLGIKPATVFHYRKLYGLLRGQGQSPHTLYAIYGRDGQYLFEGNVRECAAFLGIQENTVRQYISRFRAGMRTPVEIYAEDMRRPIRRTVC